jgi:2-oxoglutarate dehydrogenase E1 component
MADYSFVFNAHPTFIESLYKQYQEDPNSVEEGWRVFFKGFDFGGNGNGEASLDGTTNMSGLDMEKERQVWSLIKAYRNRGHLRSTTNPIKERRDRRPDLDLTDFGLSDADLDKTFQAGNEIKGLTNATLREIITQLEKIYCRNIGFEYHQIEKRENRRWLRQRIEEGMTQPHYGISLAKKKRILEKLNGAVGFENFLHTKYVGQKRFSLEGGETAIPALDAIINRGSELGVEEFVIGMAHRGRLNVLANIMGKTYQQIFNEFEGTAVPDLSFGDGDVKYHLGFSSQIDTTTGKKVHLKLVPNPSHLESVDPIVEGFARAKADILYNSEFDRILPILIHGDAALAGQGVVYETVQMSQLEGYFTGGTLHFVINNQIGFTTDWHDARSSTYSTGVASLVQAPVFHVNGDDPEAVVFVVELAMEYRQKFHTDVFIDMVCYRRHGHNEGDDPKFTQPQMYQIIKSHPNPREKYSQELINRGDVDKELAENMEKGFWEDLQKKLDEVREKPLPYEYQAPEEEWRKLKRTPTTLRDFEESPETGISKESVEKIVNSYLEVPKDFNAVGKIKRVLKNAKKLWAEEKLDWGMAELLAYGSILIEGKNVRMSGQDVGRGTFSHRHAVLHEDGTEKDYVRINHIQEDQGKFLIYNSLLSEFGVLGFEYGYSLATPDHLVIWEAQFGDFYNGAQTIVDQYISAGESKWQRMSGLVMLLPHGYEGQGPEHSSARVERFLQLCAEFNMTVANCTTPANFFHIIRRQLARPFRKPLIIMTPKSGLRHPEVISNIDAFTDQTKFHEVLDDPEFGPRQGKKVKTLLLCSGKVYFDLLARKREEKRDDVAIVRVEQMYPMPLVQLEKIFKKYSNAKIKWVQEEPGNMGGWQYVLSWYCGQLNIELVARKTSASPATGFKKVHEATQAAIVDRAFS